MSFNMATNVRRRHRFSSTAIQLRGFLLVALAFSTNSSAVTSSYSSRGVVVNTQYGPVKGDTEGRVSVFRGIRFAEPPIGVLRFHPPVPPRLWTEIQPALDFAPACPQVVSIDPTENNNSVMSEDCLAVNVWTPKADSKTRPVLVFIHGGAFVEGSARNTWYDGSTLADRGNVIIVTLQYRLGVLGFLELSEIAGKEYAKSGNLGILDQIAALQWVQHNISAFGGNPNNVTIFGESVGATSVGILMAVPAARGLFHKVILESNSAVRVGNNLPRATELAREFMKVAGASGAEDLQKMSMLQIRNAQEKLFETVFGDSSFGPTWDGVVMPEPAMKMLLSKKGARVPVLLGTNLDEIRFWSTVEELPLERKPEPLLQQQVSAIVGSRAKEVINIYRDANANYGDAVIHLETDLLFRMTSIRMADAISDIQPTYMYLFTYRSSSPVTKYGSAHSMELPFVFGVIDNQDAIAFTGRDPHRAALMQQMQQAWISFSQTGDPNNSGLPRWPKYNSSTRATMELGNTCHVVDDPYPTQRAAWDGIPFDGINPSVEQVSQFLSVNDEKDWKTQQ
jgi:para-nitrobenzyl esterase